MQLAGDLPVPKEGPDLTPIGRCGSLLACRAVTQYFNGPVNPFGVAMINLGEFIGVQLNNHLDRLKILANHLDDELHNRLSIDILRTHIFRIWHNLKDARWDNDDQLR